MVCREQGGQAVADVVFGDCNPPEVAADLLQEHRTVPGFEDYSMKGRTYRFMSDPLFPFGFGLSYTTFSLGVAHTSKSEITRGESVELTVPVMNTGKCDGD